MLSCGSGASVSSNTQPLTSVNIVTNLDRNTTQVHVSALVLAAIVSVVLDGDRQSTCGIWVVVDFCNLALVFRCQNIVMFGSYINAFVHLCNTWIDGVFSCSEW